MKSAGLTRVSVTLSAVALLALGSAGCATKKYVAQQLDPVNGRVSGLEKKTDETNKTLSALDEKVQTDVSRLDERTKSAESIGTEANNAAKAAADQAQQARGAADQARGVADKGMQRLDTVDSELNHLGNYKLVKEQSVWFAFGKSVLTDEGKQALDALATEANGRNNFVVEVQGYTDKTGQADYNLELSRKRAAVVVRYLVGEKQIALRNIHTIGMGAAPLKAEEKVTRETRKQSRRVDIKIYVQDLKGGSESASLPPNTASVR